MKPDLLDETVDTCTTCLCEHGGTRCGSTLAGEVGPLCGPCSGPVHNGRHASTAVPIRQLVQTMIAWLDQTGHPRVARLVEMATAPGDPPHDSPIPVYRQILELYRALAPSERRILRQSLERFDAMAERPHLTVVATSDPPAGLPPLHPVDRLCGAANCGHSRGHHAYGHGCGGLVQSEGEKTRVCSCAGFQEVTAE